MISSSYVKANFVANRELIARFEQKNQATLARVWGEELPGATVGSAMEVVTELSN